MPKVTIYNDGDKPIWVSWGRWGVAVAVVRVDPGMLWDPQCCPASLRVSTRQPRAPKAKKEAK